MGRCIVVDVDGEPVRLQLAAGADWTDEDNAAFVELIRAVRRMHQDRNG